jgi:hypothetical protein
MQRHRGRSNPWMSEGGYLDPRVVGARHVIRKRYVSSPTLVLALQRQPPRGYHNMCDRRNCYNAPCKEGKGANGGKCL